MAHQDTGVISHIRITGSASQVATRYIVMILFPNAAAAHNALIPSLFGLSMPSTIGAWAHIQQLTRGATQLLFFVF